MRWVLAMALVLGASNAPDAEARSGRKAKQRAAKAPSVDALVEAEVERTLPKGLAVANISVPASLARHRGKHDVIALRWRQTPRKGRSIVQVLVHKRNGRAKKGWARVELVELGTVVVAAVDLEAGSLIEAGDLRVEERPQTEPTILQVEPTYLLGSRVVRARQAGEPVRKEDVSMPLPIARGTEVRVQVRRGGVVVATSGVLENKAMVGTHTRVRVSGKLVSGKLTRPDLVELGGIR